MHDRVSRNTLAGLAGLAVVVLLAVCLPALAGCGNEKPTYSSQTQEEFRPLVDLGSQVVLSSDQDKIISQYGYPSHFFITLDTLTNDRVETWTYFPQKRSYTFHNGRQLRKETVEDQSAEYPPTTLKPEDFGSTLTLAEAGQMLGEPYQSSDFKDDKGDGVIILFYNEAILDYTNGKLSGVDTMVHLFNDFPQTTFP